MDEIKFLSNPRRKPAGKGAEISFLSRREAETARAYHKSFSQYAPTPLTELPNLAQKLGVGRIFVKDESHRFGLNAFKVLGASYAIGRYLAGRLGEDISKISFERL